MPVVYELDHVRGRIHTRCLGPVTLEEVMGHFAQLGRDPACPEALDVLLDLSAQTSLPTSAQLGAVTTGIAGVEPRVRFRRCAIIAPDDAMFGMSRMFEVFAEKHFDATRVFREDREATLWLDAIDRSAP